MPSNMECMHTHAPGQSIHYSELIWDIYMDIVATYQDMK